MMAVWQFSPVLQAACVEHPPGVPSLIVTITITSVRVRVRVIVEERLFLNSHWIQIGHRLWSFYAKTVSEIVGVFFQAKDGVPC
jgi:hypothetical protein